MGAADSSLEAEADRAALAVGEGRTPAPVGGQTSPLVQRAAAGAAPAAAVVNPCPSTHTMADDVHAAITTAWSMSGHGGATVSEHGGRIVTDSAAKRAIRTGAGGSGSISLPAEQTGDTTLGTFHTHPYSASEGSHLGISFSGGDIANFIAGGQGQVKYVGAGSCNYALTIHDAAAVAACRRVDIAKRWNDSYAAASGSMGAKVETAVADALRGCGICYYKACRPDATKPIPKVMNTA
jgi:hypothetical protein